MTKNMFYVASVKEFDRKKAINSKYLASGASASRLANFDGLLRIAFGGFGHRARDDFLENNKEHFVYVQEFTNAR